MGGPRSVWTTRRGGARPVRQAPSTRGRPETRLRDAWAAPLGPCVPTCAPRRALQGQVLPLARGREAVSGHAGTGQTWSAWPPASVAGSPRLPSLAAAVGRCQWHVIEGHRSRKVPEDRAEQASPPPAGPQTRVPLPRGLSVTASGPSGLVRTWTKREGFHDSAGEVGGRQRWGLWLARHGPGGRRSQRSDGAVADGPHMATRVPPVSSRRGSHTLPGEPLPVTPTLPKLTRTGRRSGRALGITLTPTFHSSVLLFLLGIHYFLINPISVSSADTSFFNLQLHAEARGGVHSSVSPPSLLPNN